MSNNGDELIEMEPVEEIEQLPPPDELAQPDEVAQAIDFLRKRIRDNGGRLPPPEDTEFYSMIDYLMKDKDIRLKHIAEVLSVNYNSLKTNLYRARKLIEAAKSVGQKGMAEEVLGPQLTKVVVDQFRSYFRKSADSITADIVALIVGTGLEFYDKHYSWCKENGKDAIQCLNEGMYFYRKYKDRIEELESKLRDYRSLAVALLSQDKQIMAKIALVEAFKEILEQEIARGVIPPDKLPEILKAIERYVSEVVMNE